MTRIRHTRLAGFAVFAASPLAAFDVFPHHDGGDTLHFERGETHEGTAGRGRTARRGRFTIAT